MTKSSSAEHTQRINTAMKYLKRKWPVSEAVSALITTYGISRRQAYRYIEEAEKAKGILPIPEPKVVFTVKLSARLADRLRKLSRATGRSLSDMVSEALRTFLEKGNRCG